MVEWSRTPFLILNFLDFDVYVVMTPIFPANQTLHTEPAPAVRAAVKTVLSCQSFALHRKQCISVVRVDLHRRKEAIKVFIREVNSNKYIINTVLPSSYSS